MSAPKATLVGGFILGGFGIGVCAILLFSSVQLFHRHDDVVVFFRDSVAGLTEGANVTFRGVKVGQVKEMSIHINQADHSLVIPVRLQLEPGNIVWTNPSASGKELTLEDAVKAGLRAQLTQQSLITGIMTVNLDLYPKAAAVPIQYQDGILEIPTIPSEIEMLKDQLLGLDLPQLGAQAHEALASLKQTLDGLSAAIGPVSGKLGATLDSTNAAIQTLQAGATRTLAHYDQLELVTQDQISVDGKELAVVLNRTEEAMTRANAVLASLEDMTGPRSQTRTDLEASVRDLAASASSLREFTHDFERRPLGVLLRNPPP
jgi:paraquat-inducible protein B